MNQTLEMAITKKYLHLPIRTGAPRMLVRLAFEGKQVREFDAEIDPKAADFTAAADVTEFAGRTLELTLAPVPPIPDEPAVALLPAGELSEMLEAIGQSDDLPDNGNLYEEHLRPQFHFTSKIGWNNDPNGLMYYDGEYHLFYQHNPFGWNHGNMHWGHAISRDLVRWTETDEALFPDELGTMFSGSGVVDHGNTAGLQQGSEKTLVCIYTAAGGTSPWSAESRFTQCIAYSVDRGKTWLKHPKNPVLGHIIGGNRDPKVIWHEPTKRWVMALYLEEHDYAIYTSPNLVEWERGSDLTIPGTTECPDLFDLPVDGDSNSARWVFWGARGEYSIGGFDGRTFTVESGPHRFQYGRNYAAQTWSDIPTSDGRRIQIAWLRGDKPGMPFNQQMSFPCELTLRDSTEGVRMFAEPVRELESLHVRRHEFDLASGALAGLGDLLDIRLAIDLPTTRILVRGVPIVYDRAAGTLTVGEDAAPLAPIAPALKLQILVDRSSIEVFAQDGAVTLSTAIVPSADAACIELKTEGGARTAQSVEVFELESSWR
jgi:fructan beta-fructosidase